MTFQEFDLHEQINLGLKDVGYSEPTPIQEQSIPIILKGKDLIGAAQTGTGKTGAFVIPVLQHIINNSSEHTQALILSPTRELAQQIDEQIFALGYHTGISSATIIGGEDFAKQAKAIRSGVDIIVATPGRLIDQTKVLDVDFSHIKYLVLDEADRMLDMGFLPDVTKIIKKLPKERQTLLFSATMPEEIKKLADQFMKDPEKVEIAIERPVDSIVQRAYHVHPKSKLKLVQHILDDLEWESCIIFAATKRGVDELEGLLTKKGINAGSIHGDRSQDERNEALRKFKNGTVPVIVATDVLARGIDIDNISLIVNYDVPRAAEDYIHRIGRTGRYDKTGVAVTFVTRKDQRFFQSIQKTVGDQLDVLKLPDEVKDKGKSKGSNKSRDESKRRRKPQPKKNQDSQRQKQSSGKPDDANQKSRSRNKDKSRDKQQNSDRKRRPAPKKQDRSKNNDNRSKQSAEKTNQDKHTIPVERVKKATKRNQAALKPAKGVWGLIKSMFPKIGK